MDAVDTLRRRLNWTRGWLNSYVEEHIFTEDIQVIENEDLEGSDYGVLSLSDKQSLHRDVLSLSSQDPATSCSSTSQISINDPLAEEETASRHCSSCDWPWRFCKICLTLHRIQDAHDEDYYERDCLDTHTADLSYKDAIAYEIAGRRQEVTFKDFRSPSKAKKRRQTDRGKYYHYKAVKPGQVDALHVMIEAQRHPWRFQSLPNEGTLFTMTKAQLYQEAQRYPRPPTYHKKRSPLKSCMWKFAYEQRKQARKHAVQRLQMDVEDDPLFEEADLPNSVWPHFSGDDSVARYDDEWAECKRSDYCRICEARWGRCCVWDHCEVGMVESLHFASDGEGGKWKLSWSCNSEIADNRAADVLEYGMTDWYYPERKDGKLFDDWDVWIPERYLVVG